MPGKTLAEKSLARAARLDPSAVSAGDVVTANVDVAMSHDNSALIKKIFGELGTPRVFDPSRMVFVLDHKSPADDLKIAENHQTIRQFAKAQGVTNFYDVGEGICHQILPEHGHVGPGMLIVGTDSHSTTYGAFGAFGTAVGATEMAAIWATGSLWMQVPETIKIEMTGQLQRGVYPKDAVLRIIGEVGADGANYKAVEYHGEAVRAFGIPERMTIANMACEMGAKAAMVPPDETTRAFLNERNAPWDPLLPDTDARYERTVAFDASDLEPQISAPHAVDNVHPLSKYQGLEIQQAFIGSCTNGRREDLAEAARILEGRKVAPGVRLIVIAASRENYLEALTDGSIATIVRAGGTLMNPGCGPCLGGHQGLLAPGERCISGANRNFKGRMGSPEAEIYLASPAAVAASAVEGRIADPRPYLN